MQIVINIRKEDYQALKQGHVPFNMLDTIMNGTPLPKGHGKLVDISKIDEDKIESDNLIIYLTINGQYTEAISLDYINNLPTIIEADKAESEDKE